MLFFLRKSNRDVQERKSKRDECFLWNSGMSLCGLVRSRFNLRPWTSVSPFLKNGTFEFWIQYMRGDGHVCCYRTWRVLLSHLIRPMLIVCLDYRVSDFGELETTNSFPSGRMDDAWSKWVYRESDAIVKGSTGHFKRDFHLPVSPRSSVYLSQFQF